jgi:hypothetical protein
MHLILIENANVTAIQKKCDYEKQTTTNSAAAVTESIAAKIALLLVKYKN